MDSDSPLQKARLKYKPQVPQVLKDVTKLVVKQGKPTQAVRDAEALKKLFSHTFGQPQIQLASDKQGKAAEPLRIGVVLSGGQAPGGHNVIAGLFDALKAIHPQSILIGFLGGPSGIVDNTTKELTTDLIAHYRNQGGFDIIGSGRTKIETPEQIAASEATMRTLNLDGLVVIGGDDSNTNAAVLAEAFLAKGCRTRVIGVPKTIDGDLKNEQIEISFGHDTACKVYSEMISNIMRDAWSARKYYHFIKLMGRSASHITLECAFQTHPNITLIGEEVAAQRKTLTQITNDICDVICKRAEMSKNFGVILIPEGLIEFIPEVGTLISELNHLLADAQHAHKVDTAASTHDKVDYLCKLLTAPSASCLKTLPEAIQGQLLVDRDPHGNVQVSRIDTEQLLMATVGEELKKRKKSGTYQGKFSAINHFFGYEGRSAMPSNFDAQYCYALGLTAGVLIASGLTGYLSSVQHLSRPVSEWSAGGVPLTMMMNIEQRHGKPRPVIHKALVELDGAPFKAFSAVRERWAMEDEYRFPGPIQFAGDPAIVDAIPFTLGYETK
jgi:diphosphate-dependent phosphofructokinase